AGADGDGMIEGLPLSPAVRPSICYRTSGWRLTPRPLRPEPVGDGHRSLLAPAARSTGPAEGATGRRRCCAHLGGVRDPSGGDGDAGNRIRPAATVPRWWSYSASLSWDEDEPGRRSRFSVRRRVRSAPRGDADDGHGGSIQGRVAGPSATVVVRGPNRFSRGGVSWCTVMPCPRSSSRNGPTGTSSSR